MDINLVQDTSDTLISGISTFPFYKLSYQDTTATRTTAQAWYALINVASTPSTQNTTECFCGQGTPTIEDWGDVENTCAQYAAFVITLLGDTHPVRTILLLLIWFFDWHRY